MNNKPGEKVLDAIKKLNNSVALFKIPKIPQKKKDKVKILTEEQYVDELGKIIEREFFPHLEKLRAQNQYLDAVEKNDVSKLRELYAKYSGKRPSRNSSTGFESPATFETPLNNAPADTTPNSIHSHSSITSQSSTGNKSHSDINTANISDGHNLDSFLTNYTSEDNHSFHEIIEIADKKLRQRFSILYDAENEKAIEMSEQLALPDIEAQFQAIEGPKLNKTWTYKNKNYIMYVPDGVDLTTEEKMEMSRIKQEISHRNTRLAANLFDDNKQTKSNTMKISNSNKLLANKIGVDGNLLPQSSSSQDQQQSPQIRGFGFVKTPSPCPGVNDSPLMTWGEIEGTPFRLDGSDTPISPQVGPTFRIAATSRRENIALELAEKAGERMRGQKAKAIEAARRNIASPHVCSTLDRLASMSPAAKRLASSRLGLKETLLTPSPSRQQLLTTSINLQPKSQRKSLATTPSPLLVRRKTQSTISLIQTPTNSANIQSPISNISPEKRLLDVNKSTATSSQALSTDPLLTDDLLNIPSKRNKASDFF